MKVSNYDLASYNEATQSWDSAAGTYKLHFAASVADVRATSTYKLAKPMIVKCHDVLPPKK